MARSRKQRGAEAAADAAGAAPNPEARVEGVLYAIGEGTVTLAEGPGLLEGRSYDLAESDGHVTLNGQLTGPHDLRRGDKVVLLGDPVYGVEATR